MGTALISAALTLAYKGMRVFPCRPRDKRPATPNGLKDATNDMDKIRQWWRHEPNLNVAILTGASSGVFVVDLDGIDAEVELRKLERANGEIPPTVESITARGRHLYFRMPAVSIRNSSGRIAPGIDVRAEGGYVVAPPSVHPSGKSYAWSVDSADTFAIAPQWLLSKITVQSTETHLPSAKGVIRDMVVAGADEGQRNDCMTRLVGYLLRRLDPIIAAELAQLWNASYCRPPLPENEARRIIDSIAGRELRRRLGDDGC
jgi:Bifunctional DNA primase/polymerase, N-terminal/Primase C terminal 1 (PriCT-1)